MASFQPGLGVMIANMAGNGDSVEAFKEALGKKIAVVKLNGDELQFTMEDGYRFGLYDDGQSCCERRYMVCDDDLASFAGATLMDGEVASAPDDDGGNDDAHEVQFLRVHTDKGVIVCSNHNEHNGYYGGFAIRARKLKKESN